MATILYAKIREGFPPFRVPTVGQEFQKTKQRYLKKRVVFKYRSESNPGSSTQDFGDVQSDWECQWTIHRLSGQVSINNSDSYSPPNPSATAESQARFLFSVFFTVGNFFNGDIAHPPGTYRITATHFALADGYITFQYDYVNSCVVGIHMSFESDTGKQTFDLDIELSEPYTDTEYLGDLMGLTRVDDDYYAVIKAANDYSASAIFYNRDNAYPQGNLQVLNPTVLPQMISDTNPLRIEKTRLSFDMRFGNILGDISEAAFCPPFNRTTPPDLRHFANEADFNIAVVCDFRFSTRQPICVSTGMFDQDNHYLGTRCEAVPFVDNVRIWRTSPPQPVDDSHTNFYGYFGFLFDAGPPDHIQIGSIPNFSSPSAPIGPDQCSSVVPPP